MMFGSSLLRRGKYFQVKNYQNYIKGVCVCVRARVRGACACAYACACVYVCVQNYVHVYVSTIDISFPHGNYEQFAKQEKSHPLAWSIRYRSTIELSRILLANKYSKFLSECITCMPSSYSTAQNGYKWYLSAPNDCFSVTPSSGSTRKQCCI